MTHLILHKVRGKPAFDIASQLENGWWVLSTGGWRVYPWATWPLGELLGHVPDWRTTALPADWPDCFAASLTAAPKRDNVKPVTLEELGL